jgi:hypothetical protein
MSELDIKSPEFEFDLVAKYSDRKETYGDSVSFVDFGTSDKTGLESLGWISKSDPSLSVFVDLKDGTFTFNGLKVAINLGLTGFDECGNVRTVDTNELVFEPIWFRRVRNDCGPNGVVATAKYCVGWKVKYNDRVHQKIAMIDKESICLSDSK